jgi:hypothetical protein
MINNEVSLFFVFSDLNLCDKLSSFLFSRMLFFKEVAIAFSPMLLYHQNVIIHYHSLSKYYHYLLFRISLCISHVLHLTKSTSPSRASSLNSPQPRYHSSRPVTPTPDCQYPTYSNLSSSGQTQPSHFLPLAHQSY